MSALPAQAIDPRVFDSMFTSNPCSCESRDGGDTWHLCQYHDGMNDGLAMQPTYVEVDGVMHCPTHDVEHTEGHDIPRVCSEAECVPVPLYRKEEA